MILTSHADLDNTDEKTGVWLGEFTDPYYEFIDEGYEVTLASPKGGEPPLDPTSLLTENITGSNRRYQKDEQLQNAFKNTIKLSEIEAADFDALFFPGGHGPIWDLATDEKCGQLILDFYNSGKYVAAVCHGPAALLSAANIDADFLSGKKVSCFSNTEEKLVNKVDKMPYLLEDRMKELGAEIDNALVPFASKVVKDGLLITGQNPLSAGPAAKELIDNLK